MVVPCGGGWALCARIGMTINLQGYPTLMTQCYLAMNNTHAIQVVYSCTIINNEALKHRIQSLGNDANE